MTEGALLRVAIEAPLRRLFDYRPPPGVSADAIAPGSRVRVPFGARQLIGLLVERGEESSVPASRLRSANAVLDAEPLLDETLLGLLRWAAAYYHHPIGEVIAAALPKSLRAGAALHEPETRWRTTPEGVTAAATAALRRAPVQRQLLERLAAAGADGLGAAELEACAPSWRGPLRGLLRHGFITALERHTTVPGSAGDAGDVLVRNAPFPPMTPEQEQAVAAVTAQFGRFGTFLLQGITGSGKTEVYLRLVEGVLARGRQALVLVPEIGLTPQLVARFRDRFAAPLAVLHSGLSDRERLDAWRAGRAGVARVLIGTRSAVFAALPALGLIVIDEEHDASFKQQEGGFRYSARDLAIVRAQAAAVPIVLGSATPSLESLQNVASGRFMRLSLPRRTAQAQPPRVVLIDLRTETTRHGLSGSALEAIDRHLTQGGQVLVFINRRGYAPTLVCTACGWIAPCMHCDARLIVHQAARQLRCHHCGAETPLPEHCTQCGYTVKPVGQGTERLEETLQRLFPAAPLVRLDRDAVRRQGDLETVMARVASGEARILVGTQMVTKGHHFPDLTLVVVVNGDQGLFSTDFRAAERLAQTIVQVGGRAGRGTRAGEVLIQTEYPGHPLLGSLLQGGYEGFAQAMLAERAAAQWPPFSHLALLRASGTAPDAALAFLHEVRHLAHPPPGVKLRGPAPAAMVRRAGRFRAQLLVESDQRGVLHRFLDTWLPEVEAAPSARRVRWALDVDPLELC